MKNNGIIVIVAFITAFVLGIGVQFKMPLLSDNHAHPEQTAPLHPEENAHGHGHGHGDEKSSQMTVYDDLIEVFLEHPYLVAGNGAEFVTHVSYMRSGMPRTEGPVTFVIQKGQEKPIEHIEKAPARDGIYIPTLTFPNSGRWKLSLAVPGGEGEHRIDLEDVLVYANQQEADDAPDQEELEGISFLKEEQWKWRTLTGFVIQAAHGGSLMIPHSGIVYDRDSAFVYAQVSGEMVQRREITTGQSQNGMVEVISGLKEGERIITRSAYVIAQKELGEPGALDHGSSKMVHLDESVIEKQQIQTALSTQAVLSSRVNLNGQITLNADRRAVVVPKLSGVVRNTPFKVGDKVQKGDILAWIESNELGRAKSIYIKSLAEMACTIERDRAQKIYTNTKALLDYLASEPSVESLVKASYTDTGEYRSKLISAYTCHRLALSVYNREKQLYDQKIGSQADYLQAQTDFQTAVAEYASLLDSIRYKIHHNLIEARQAQQHREIAVQNSQNELYILGLTEDEIKSLDQIADSHVDDSSVQDHDAEHAASDHSHDGHDPHGHEEAGLTETGKKLTWYPLRAPFAGTILEKQIALGEHVTGDQDAFVLADLDTVWAEFQVHAKDTGHLGTGQKILVRNETDEKSYDSVLSYVAPIVNQATRTCLVRATMPNETGQYRPGQFVRGALILSDVPVAVSVNVSAVQYIDDKPYVFVKVESGFEKRAVELGFSNSDKVEILSGLTSGEAVVNQNAFTLKSESERNPDAYGGHGHPH
ncbi:MAG: efflux RND transporter periplasmic adaptor subunit [Phycisphaerae bacterium]|nr:efflux RND transporter periplasmic adaptor subunit [Phycisphaerae bacterium]